MFESDDWVKCDTVAWEAELSSEWCASEKCDDVHITCRGARILWSLTDLPQEGKSDGIRPADAAVTVTRALVI